MPYYYVLELKGGKYYVGISEKNAHETIKRHFLIPSEGEKEISEFVEKEFPELPEYCKKWLCRFHPIGTVEISNSRSYIFFGKCVEKAMNEFGLDNVRANHEYSEWMEKGLKKGEIRLFECSKCYRMDHRADQDEFCVREGWR